MFPLLFFWISLLWKMGLIGCPETSVPNYHTLLHNIPEKRRSHLMIWQCRPWFGSKRSGWEWSALLRSGSALRTQSYNDLIYLNAKFKEKRIECRMVAPIWRRARPSSCIWVNMVFDKLNTCNRSLQGERYRCVGTQWWWVNFNCDRVECKFRNVSYFSAIYWAQ